MVNEEPRKPTSEELSDPGFWQALLPDFHIGERPFRGVEEEYRFSAAESDRVTRQIRKEGYFLSEPIVPAAETEKLAQAVTRLAAAGVMPPFIGVYDEFWQFLCRMRHAFSPIVGEGYRFPPDFWVWYIAPNAQSGGWTIHRDAQLDRPYGPEALVREDGSARMCTMWLPLTDVDTHNSCIYVLPFPHDPAVQSFLRRENLAAIQQAHSRIFLPDVRALPARAGSVLGWSPYILHWGARSTDWATRPRISIALYLRSADATMSFTMPFDDAGRRTVDLEAPDLPLDFGHRRTIVANVLATYIDNGHMKSEQNFSPAVAQFSARWKRGT